jgi:hypothetical protein
MKHTNLEIDQYSRPMSLLEKGLCGMLVLFIISLVGSAIWGAEGFVELLAGFIN